MKKIEYREQALRILPWVCAKCGRDFSGKNLRQLTVHHKDHDYRNNPPEDEVPDNLPDLGGRVRVGKTALWMPYNISTNWQYDLHQLLNQLSRTYTLNYN